MKMISSFWLSVSISRKRFFNFHTCRPTKNGKKLTFPIQALTEEQYNFQTTSAFKAKPHSLHGKTSLNHCQNPLHQFPRSKAVTSWRGQKSVVSFHVTSRHVMSCHFQNSITTTCCRLVGDMLTCQDSLPSLTIPQQVDNSTGKLRRNVSNGFWALTSSCYATNVVVLVCIADQNRVAQFLKLPQLSL